MGSPLELFQVMLSNGERFFDSTGLPLLSIMRYSDRVRYSFNQQWELVIEYGLKPLQFIRIEVDLPTVGAGISSIEVEAVGDNISLGMRERAGQVDILNEIGTRAELLGQWSRRATDKAAGGCGRCQRRGCQPSDRRVVTGWPCVD